MTVKALISKKDYALIEYRHTLPEMCGGGDTLFGYASSKNGELISLDGDTYDENDEIIKYEEWIHDGQPALTVLIEGEWILAGE